VRHATQTRAAPPSCNVSSKNQLFELTGTSGVGALGGQFPLHQGGVVATIISNPRPQPIVDVDWTIDPFFHDTLTEYRSITVQLF
jgi:hypothetical protein